MSDGETRIVRLQFEMGQLLPSADSASVPLLRLMAATNDVMLMQKLVNIARERVEAANEFEKALLNGELGYFVRMLCGHLYEAGIAFRALEIHLKDQIDRLVEADPAARQAFETIRKIYQDRTDTGFDKALLGPIRNLTGFHYKENTFADGLEALKTKGEIILSEHIGFTRYTLVDDILTRKTWEIMGGADQYKATLRSVFGLADELAIGVTHLLKHRLDVAKVPLQEAYGSVPIAPEILRTREKIENEGKKQQ